MKLVNKQTAVLSVLALSVGLFTIAPRVMAQDDTLLTDTEEVLDSSEPIDVDGTHRRQTEADRMAKVRRNLEAKNEELVRKKIEDVRMKEEMRMTKRLANAFSTGMGNLDNDEVKTTQAAPVVAALPPAPAVVTAPAPVVEPTPDYNFAGTKIIPNTGLLMIKGDKIDFESKFNGGLMVESMVLPRLSFGIGFNYATLDLVDLDGYSSSYNQYYNTGYYNSYGQGRELSYKHMNVELNSKLFLAQDTRIRPYVGVGLGFNKTKLQFNNNNSYTNTSTNSQFGNEEYNSTYASGLGLIGAEAVFTKNVGMNVEFKYARGFTNMQEESAKQASVSPDQDKLNRIGQAIEEANFMSINAGLIVSF